MLITKLELCWLLLAQTVKFEAPNSSVAMPKIRPLESSKESPLGSGGYISQLLTTPPSVVGDIEACVTLTVRLTYSCG